jgi:hypothetical protein
MQLAVEVAVLHLQVLVVVLVVGVLQLPQVHQDQEVLTHQVKEIMVDCHLVVQLVRVLVVEEEQVLLV